MTTEIGHYMEAVSRLRGELEICNKNFEAMRETASTNEALAEELAEALSLVLHSHSANGALGHGAAHKGRAALERYQQEREA